MEISQEEFVHVINKFDFDRVVTTSQSMHFYYMGLNVLEHNHGKNQSYAYLDGAECVNRKRREDKYERVTI